MKLCSGKERKITWHFEKLEGDKRRNDQLSWVVLFSLSPWRPLHIYPKEHTIKAVYWEVCCLSVKLSSRSPWSANWIPPGSLLMELKVTKLCFLLLLASIPIQWPLFLWHCFPTGDRNHSPAVYPLQRVLSSLEGYRTSTWGLFSRKAAACLCSHLSRSFGLSRNEHLTSLESLLRDSLFEYLGVFFTGVLSAASSRAGTSAEWTQNIHPQLPDPGRAFLRLFFEKREGVKCVSRAWQEPTDCCLPWMGSKKAFSEMGWLEGTLWQTSVSLPRQLIC